MYQYDELDQRLVDERVEQFRRQVQRRLSGEITEDQFKPLRLMNGLYLQLHAYMLRVAIPYGCLNSEQVRRLAHIARTYDKGYGHLTTRQNIQYNWPRLQDTPDILKELAEVQMHAIQTSGNCIRNVTADQYAGRAADEIEDPRAWCEILRQWSTFHPEFSYLPRKFKIAVTGSPNDRAAVKVHDIGLRMHRNEQGEPGFEVMAGGGLGRTPFVAKVLQEWLPKEHLLSYVEAILRIYNMLGRRDNLFKARIKVTIHEMGADEFKRLVDEEWEQIKDGPLKLSKEEIDRIWAHFAPPEWKPLPDECPELEEKLAGDPAFRAWYEVNCVPHRAPGYQIVNLSVKPVGKPPGDVSADQLDAVADLADQYSLGEVRVTHAQNLVFVDVEKSRLHELWQKLDAVGLATPNVNLAGDIICCPGLDYCSLANARSIPIAERISERLADVDRQRDIGELQIKMSGCMNACGHHHVGHIGILGVDKKGAEFYQLTLGGAADQDAAIGKIVGRGFSSEEIVDAIEKVLDVYTEIRDDGERFIDTYRRVGADPFKERLYAADPGR